MVFPDVFGLFLQDNVSGYKANIIQQLVERQNYLQVLATLSNLGDLSAPCWV